MAIINTLNGTYLRLDCANDPLTDTLHIQVGVTSYPAFQVGTANNYFQFLTADMGGLGVYPYLKAYSTGSPMAEGLFFMDYYPTVVGGNGTTLPQALLTILDVDTPGKATLKYDGGLDVLILDSVAGFVIGSGEGGHDYFLSIDGQASDFIAYWRESLATPYLDVQGNILLNAIYLYFGDTSSYIYDDGTNLTYITDGKHYFGQDLLLGSEGLIIDSIRSFWAFKYADGLGANDTGIRFNTVSGAMEFVYIGTNFAQFFAATGNLTIGIGGGDVTQTFHGTVDGILKWWEDEDYFEIQDDFLLNSTEAIYFRDTDLKIYSSADGQLDIDADTELEITTPLLDLDGDLDVSGELKGCRQHLFGGRQSAFSADAYAIMGVGGTLAFSATQGYVMPRAGSIVGLSSNLNITTETTQGNIEVQVRVNDTPVYSILIDSGGAGAAVKKGYGTQARGTDTFAAGDYIQLYYLLTYDTFVGTITGTNIICEIVYDS